MRLWIVWSAMVIVPAFAAGLAVAAEPSSAELKEDFVTPGLVVERHDRETQAPIPESIQQDMYQSACKFLENVYPDIDKDWMRKECGKALLKDRYGLLRVHYHIWPPMARVLNTATIKMDVGFPWCDVLEVEALNPPPGVVPDVLEKPLTLEEAQARARRVLARVVGDADRASRFKVTRHSEAQDDYDGFDFDEFAPPPGHYSLATCSIDVRRSNGSIKRCEWSAIRLRPKVPYEKVVEMAKAAGRQGKREDDIVLSMAYDGGSGELVWFYSTPLPRGGWPTHDDTSWDAMTGELVYSKVLHGGTEKKPYENPKYFPAVTDELIKRNLETLIKERVAELEKKEKEKKNE